VTHAALPSSACTTKMRRRRGFFSAALTAGDKGLVGASIGIDSMTLTGSGSGGVEGVAARKGIRHGAAMIPDLVLEKTPSKRHASDRFSSGSLSCRVLSNESSSRTASRSRADRLALAQMRQLWMNAPLLSREVAGFALVQFFVLLCCVEAGDVWFSGGA